MVSNYQPDKKRNFAYARRRGGGGATRWGDRNYPLPYFWGFYYSIDDESFLELGADDFVYLGQVLGGFLAITFAVDHH